MKKVITLGITGSIAAYKAADLTSQLMKKGFDVRIIMTENAQKLIAPITLFTLCQKPIVTSLWDIPDWRPGHIALADDTDLFVVVPATANFIGKYTNGIADDALTTFALSFDGPVMIAPAMNPRMWNHIAVQTNISTLKQRQVTIIEPATGIVACGDKGKGKLATITDLITAIESVLDPASSNQPNS